MNKSILAITILQLNLGEWEPVRNNDKFFIIERKTGIILGKGNTLTIAVLAARDKIIKRIDSGEYGKFNKTKYKQNISRKK